ncbi:hypothetical protein BYT27DRAFT_7215857 [Phlegmacium glaucopus]|nr:hypothetical protein BYT27DRAFT_7215857 [Phlegmacium glaucopus]
MAVTPLTSEFGDEDNADSESERVMVVDDVAAGGDTSNSEEEEIVVSEVKKEKISSREAIEAKCLIPPPSNTNPFNPTQDVRAVASSDAALKHKCKVGLGTGKKAKTGCIMASSQSVRVGVRSGGKNTARPENSVAVKGVSMPPAEIEASYGGWGDEEIDESIARVVRTIAETKGSKDAKGSGFCATTIHTRFNQDNLPPAIKILWKSIFIPTFCAHLGSLRGANPFTPTNPVDLVQHVVKQVYPKHYLDLKKSQSLVPKGAVYDLAIAATHTWCTGIKTAANKALEAEFLDEDRYPDKQAIIDYVAMVANPNNPIFHWRVYTDSVKSGTYKDPVLIATFAVGHLKFVLGACTSEEDDYPFVRMALSLAATASLNTGAWDRARAATLDFLDHTFGSQASSYLQAMISLKTKKWITILAAAEAYLNHGSTSGLVAAYSGISSEGEMFDPRAKVDESEDENDCIG